MTARPGPTVGPESASGVNTRRVIFLATAGSFGGLLLGYHSAVINGANQALEVRFGISEGSLGWVVAISLVASGIAAWFAGGLADRIGRRALARLAALVFVLASLGEGLPYGLTDFVAWRIVGGLAVGVASVVAPMYISEISPASMRGRLTSLFQMALVVGIFLTATVNFGVLKLAGGDALNEIWNIQAWQLMFLAMFIPSVIYFMFMLAVPRSPHHLVRTGQIEEARAVLTQAHGGDADSRIDEIRQSFAETPEPKMRDLRGPVAGLLGIVWIGMILNVFQQFVGINAVIYYSNIIYGSIGLDEQDAFVTSAISSMVNIVFTVVAIMLIDRVGRRPLLLVGSVGMAACLAVIAVVFGTAPRCTEPMLGHVINGCDVSADVGQPLLSHGSGVVAVVALNLFLAFFAATWGPVVWVLIAEMFPNGVRAAALAVCASVQWLANFAVTLAFPSLAHVSISLAYGLFTVFAVLSFWFVWVKVKETKGVGLEQMGALQGPGTSGSRA